MFLRDRKRGKAADGAMLTVWPPGKGKTYGDTEKISGCEGLGANGRL